MPENGSVFRISPREAIISAAAIGVAVAAVFGFAPGLIAKGDTAQNKSNSAIEEKIDELSATISLRLSAIERKMDVERVQDDMRLKRVECQIFDLSGCPRTRKRTSP